MTDLNDIEKTKRSPQQWTDLKFILIVAISIIGSIVLCMFYVQQVYWSGYIKTSLDKDFIPTAEYLLLHPEPTPDKTAISLHVGDEICVLSSIVVGESQVYTWPNSEIFINQQRVGIEDVSFRVSNGAIADTFPEVFCVENILEAGLHLVEFKARDGNHHLIISHQWAIEME